MSGVNKVILIGNLGKDPEVRKLESGATVCSFPIATTETYNDRKTNERREITEWHNITLWRGLAEVAEKYLHKGDKVFIEGKIRSRTWEDEKGEKRYAVDIVGDNMTMLTPKGESQGAGGSNQQESAKTPPKPESTPLNESSEEDDLPF
ncbi:single-stranded DNA-binding protein [Halocola ammonii]